MAMVQMKVEIKKDVYELIASDRSLISKLIEEEAFKLGYLVEGYGCINPDILKQDDKYYVTWSRWSSCD